MVTTSYLGAVSWFKGDGKKLRWKYSKGWLWSLSWPNTDHSKQPWIWMCAPALSCLIGVTFIKHLCGLELKNRCIFSIPQSRPWWPKIRSFSSEDHAGGSDQLTRGRTDFRSKVSGGWRGLAPHVLHTHIGALAHSHWCSWPISPVLVAFEQTIQLYLDVSRCIWKGLALQGFPTLGNLRPWHSTLLSSVLCWVLLARVFYWVVEHNYLTRIVLLAKVLVSQNELVPCPERVLNLHLIPTVTSWKHWLFFLPVYFNEETDECVFTGHLLCTLHCV